LHARSETASLVAALLGAGIRVVGRMCVVPVWKVTCHLLLLAAENASYPEDLGLFKTLAVHQIDLSGDLRKDCDSHFPAVAVIGESVLGCVPVVQIEQWVVRYQKQG
jgi:hypothetical protein